VVATKPIMVGVLKEAGLEPREFVLTSYALTLAMVHADVLKSNPLNPLPAYVPRANLGFVRAQEDRLATLFKALEDEEEVTPSTALPQPAGSPAASPTAEPSPSAA